MKFTEKYKQKQEQETIARFTLSVNQQLENLFPGYSRDELEVVKVRAAFACGLLQTNSALNSRALDKVWVSNFVDHIAKTAKGL